MPKRKSIDDDFFTPSPQNAEAAKRQGAIASKPEDDKQRLTVYLNPQVLDRLDHTRIELRRRGLSRSRSEIIEAAVGTAIEDLEGLAVELE